MAIVLKSRQYHNIKTDVNTIIGVTGYNYEEFLKSLTGLNVFYIGNIITDNDLELNNLNSNQLLKKYLTELNIKDTLLKEKICNLSHSDKRLKYYLKMFISDAKVLVIDEPFLDLDYHNKKRIIAIFNHLIKNKTIIIGSKNIDVIYSICKKVLLLNKNDYSYGDVSLLSDASLLKKYQLKMPTIVQFIELAKDKKIHLPYSVDIRDLIKDVYKNVSK